MTQLTDIRDILAERLPIGPKFVLNVSIDGPIANVTVQCGALRWERGMTIGDRDAETIAETIETDLREYLASAAASVRRETDAAREKGQPVRLRRSAQGFREWMRSEPRANGWLAA